MILGFLENTGSVSGEHLLMLSVSSQGMRIHSWTHHQSNQKKSTSKCQTYSIGYQIF